MKTRWVALLLATIMLLMPVSSVFASTSTTSFTTWETMTTAELNKVWTITFNIPLSSTSVNSNTIYVMDNKQKKITTKIELATDGLSVTVTPAQAYTAGNYFLYITNGIKSQAGAQMGEQIIVPFTVVGTTQALPKYILDIQADYNSYATNFKVQTAPDIYRVDVNKVKMQYSGKNIYDAWVYGLKRGSTILFEGYDQNGKLIQTYNYQL